MRLGKLQKKIKETNTDFLKLCQTENLDDCFTFDEIKKRLKNIFNEADKYADINNLEYKYFQLAKEPLWKGIKIPPENFIYQGFDAEISIDLNNKLDDINMFIIIKSNDVGDLKNDQRIEITPEFINTLNDLQKEIFNEARNSVEKKVIRVFKKVWPYEKERINKWINTCKINLKRK